MSTTPSAAEIQASLVSTNTPPLCMLQTAAFNLLLDQAVSGGAGTAAYLGQIGQINALMNTLAQQGASAFKIEQDPSGTPLIVTGTDGHSKLMIRSDFSPTSSVLVPNTNITGIATITMQGPGPDFITRTAQAGWEVIDTAHETYTAYELWTALFKPLGSKAIELISNLAESWSSTSAASVGDVAGEIEMTSMNVASEVSSETVSVAVDGAEVAEAAIEWGSVVETCGISLVFMFIPDIVSAIWKNFLLNFQMLNVSSYDFNWKMNVINGSAAVQPATQSLPKPVTVMNSATNTGSLVVQQADFTFANQDTTDGIGAVFYLQAADLSKPTAAVVLSISDTDNNNVTVVSPFDEAGQLIPWQTLLQANSNNSAGNLTNSFENVDIGIDIGIDALEGNSDSYNCVLRIRNL